MSETVREKERETEREKTRLIRVLIYGKEREAIEQEIVGLVQGGARALVQISGREAVPSGEQSAVGEWANALCLEHGLHWQRVGRDVLFAPGG